ncbi:MAG TPA: AlkA N-terminal domain-containing protein [Thermoleophilaceae bacterium]|nr:AlkA N-terminal domain-containing protein [Thermoleophilaceae bacterium]
MTGLDGWLTQGVVTTKIYCRPSCPARPKPENVRIFESPAAARAAGMRACKRCRPDEAAGGALVRHLAFRAPLDADALIAFFARRAVPGVEELEGDVFRRSVRLQHGCGVVELRSLGHRIATRLWLDDGRDEGEAVSRVRAMLDLDADPEAIADALARDELMRELVAEAPGRRVPGCADPNEIAIRAVLGQQVSLAGAATLAGRLVAAYGEPLARPIGSVTHAFPSADALADGGAIASGADVLAGGADTAWAMPASRQRAIRGLAAALASGDVVLHPDADRPKVEDRLLALPGVGPWTASYIAMRALRDSDAFLASDLGVRHALDRLGLDSRPAAAEQLSQSWRPYRAYALQHLWAVAS